MRRALRKSKTPRALAGRGCGLSGPARATQVAHCSRLRPSEVVASELRRLDALPHLDDHERDQIQRSMRHRRQAANAPRRVQELSAEPDAVDYAAALRELFALDPQTVAAVMSPEVRP